MEAKDKSETGWVEDAYAKALQLREQAETADPAAKEELMTAAYDQLLEVTDRLVCHGSAVAGVAGMAMSLIAEGQSELQTRFGRQTVKLLGVYGLVQSGFGEISDFVKRRNALRTRRLANQIGLNPEAGELVESRLEKAARAFFRPANACN